jgi:RNA polymerase sigma-70 factor (ECF subfamily)
LLSRHPSGNQPKTHALLALMLLNAARLPTRVDEEGNLLLLQDQDRTQWDRGMIARGLFHFAQSAAGSHVSAYHLQSAIAACHCSAPDYASTDWQRILSLYDDLIRFDDSPVVALNRAIVVANLRGPQAGLAAVAAIPDRDRLESYYLFYAVLGEFEARANDPLAAAGYFRRSLQLAGTRSEQRFLSRRFEECEKRIEASRG